MTTKEEAVLNRKGRNSLRCDLLGVVESFHRNDYRAMWVCVRRPLCFDLSEVQRQRRDSNSVFFSFKITKLIEILLTIFGVCACSVCASKNLFFTLLTALNSTIKFYSQLWPALIVILSPTLDGPMSQLLEPCPKARILTAQVCLQQPRSRNEILPRNRKQSGE